MTKLSIRQPDDCHLHLRQGEMLKKVIDFTRPFGRGICMGNLPQPIQTAQDVKNYYQEIKKATNNSFKPVIAVMLTNNMSPTKLLAAYETGIQIVLKLIPGGTSTGSAEGVSLPNLKGYYPVLDVAQRLKIPFLGHWELIEEPDTGNTIPEANRESKALPFLADVVTKFPELKIVVEHASTKEMINYVIKGPENLAASLTVHHAILTTNEVLDEQGKVKNPFNYCKPVAKSAIDRKAVIEAMTSGNPKFFFGSDSAPHPHEAKLKGAAGLFTAPVALPLLTEIFEQADSLEQLENFVSRFGAEFYGWPLNGEKINLGKKLWTVPEQHQGVPVWSKNKTINWQII